MASWKKYFSAVPSQSRLVQKFDRAARHGSEVNAGSGAKYASYLPEVYSGAPNRVERYIQYEQMDLDSEINKGLDIISEFSSQNYEPGEDPFIITYKDDMSETEVKLIRQMLGQWCSLNRWQQKLWRAFRNTIKYGDQIYIRDPETFKLIHINPSQIEKIIVNEAKGKEIEQYVFRDLDVNLQSLVGGTMLQHDQYNSPGSFGSSGGYGMSSSSGSRSARFNTQENQTAVDATHVVHLSLSEGMDQQWPFGTSLLESIYKVFKQKDLLEDSILIYRIVRAPERRVFYIDTGSLSGPRAQAVVERMKNEIYQRRIPNRTGGGQSIIDAAYSPLAINEDYFLATNSEGKGTRIETLQGGENLGQIDDLRYFDNKLKRGLGIPSSYLPSGPEDGTTIYNDGKVGTAYIQEHRFAKYCQRLQNLIAPVIDREFKLYLKSRGIEVESGAFELQFWEPQSFSQYRQMALDTEQIAVFSGLMQTEAAKFISKRYLLMRYLGWNEEEVLKNETLWKEENAKTVKSKIGVTVGDEDSPGLRSVGVRPEVPDEMSSLPAEDAGSVPDAAPDAGLGDAGGDAGGAAPPTGPAGI